MLEVYGCSSCVQYGSDSRVHAGIGERGIIRLHVLIRGRRTDIIEDNIDIKQMKDSFKSIVGASMMVLWRAPTDSCYSDRWTE